MTKVDPQSVRASLVEDALAPARNEGRTVNVDAAERYFADVLTGMDRKAAEAKPVAQVEAKADAATGEEFKARTGQDAGDWRVNRAPTKNSAFIHQDRLRMVGLARLRERLRWIRQRPDLFEQVKGLALALNSQDAGVRERAALKMREFIAKTDRLAGHDWRKPKPEKLFFGTKV